MPFRKELREMQSIEIGGIAVAICLARGKRVVLAIGGYDADGLLETEEDCRRTAKGFLERFDSAQESRHDRSTTQPDNDLTATGESNAD